MNASDALPFDYVEVVEVTDVPAVGAEIQQTEIAALVAEFRRISKNTVFLITEQFS